MPAIILPDVYDDKLKRLVTEPFVDTRESIIQRLIDEELSRRTATTFANGPTQSSGNSHRQLNPDSPGSLAFTRVRSATIDGREITRPKWNGIMDSLHVLGVRRLGSFESLRRASTAQLRQGRFEENGYKYLPDADLSIQGVPADVAWAHSLRLARELRVPIRLTIEWRETEGAAHPGETALLEWVPSN